MPRSKHEKDGKKSELTEKEKDAIKVR